MKRLSIAIFVGMNLAVMIFIAFKVTSSFASLHEKRTEKIDQLYDYLGR